MATLREFSSIGPCIPLGEVVKRTATTVQFKERDGTLRRKGGWRLECGLFHTEPCVSCRDHKHSQYPNGYEN